MANRSSRSTAAPAKGDLQQTPEEGKIENIVPETEKTEPVNLEVETPSEEPTPAPEATSVEKIQTEIRARLSKRSVDENVFVPANPADIENEARMIAKDCGFEFNRGQAIGARLMARAQRRGY